MFNGFSDKYTALLPQALISKKQLVIYYQKCKNSMVQWGFKQDN